MDGVHDCDCLRQRTCLYVGRAVQVRARLQVHAFGRRSIPVSPFIERLSDSPHNHILMASIWYMPKTELLRTEAWLIDNLKPTENKRDFGFSSPGDWTFRVPDVDGVDVEMLEPDRRHLRNSARRTEVRHEPGVYAWWIDPAAEHEALAELMDEIFPQHRRETANGPKEK